MLFGISEPVVGHVKSNIVGDDNGRTMASRGSDTRPTEPKVFENNEVERSYSSFASVLQISHGGEASSMASPREGESSPVLTCETAKANISLLGCPLGPEGLEICSPRIPGNKRRKNQAKKVVCIPAPAADSSRPNGEAVPSDLWAWRKYGQKPIKGSPYPRGYYRCSSSRGCSARKQVERSRTDPNMLVITYTSEHDHPLPTQRNALAGSTRSQPSKNGPSAPMKSSPRCRQLPPAMVKEEQMEAAGTTVSSAAPPVKKEALEVEMATTMGVDGDNHELEDDFFAELDELESGLMGGLVFSKEFLEGKPDGWKDNEAMDPFSSFDWAGKSFGQGRK